MKERDLATNTMPREVDLSGCSKAELERMLAAGQDIVECYRVLKKGGLNIVGELLKGQGTFYELDHFPKGDVYDEAEPAVLQKMRETVVAVEQNPEHPWHQALGDLTAEAFRKAC